MAKPSTGIGVCGVVVGLIIGAGAVLYTNHYDITASILRLGSFAYRGYDSYLPSDALEKRSLRVFDRERGASSAKIVTEPRRPRYPEPQQVTSVQPEPVRVACSERVAVVSEVREAVLSLFPRRGNTFVDHVRIENALNAIVEDCVEEVPMRAPLQIPQAVKPKARVNNHCSQYSVGTPRYTKCVVNERNGVMYQGRQTTRP